MNCVPSQKLKPNLLTMGIKGLTKTIKRIAPSAVRTMSYSDLVEISKHKVYGVDVFSRLYPTQYKKSSKGKGNHIREFMEMITTWTQHGVKLIFVLDGNTHSEAKRDTIDDRASKRLEGQATIQRLINEINDGQDECVELLEETGIVVINTDLNKIGHKILSGRGGSVEQRIELEHALDTHVIVSGDEINDLVTLFQLVGATYMKAQGEADFLLASLYKNGHIDGVISEDMDMLTHGIDRLVRGSHDPLMRRNGMVSVFTLSSILDEAKISMNQFIDLCILCGCDYCPKIDGVASVIGLQLLRKYTNINNIVASMEDKTLKYQPKGITIDEYLKRYDKAFCIFSREQEKLPKFEVKSYTIADGFRQWILNETNYTAHTLESKIHILESQEWSEHVPKIPQISKTGPVSPIRIKIKTKNIANSNSNSKLKVKLKVKLKEKSKSEEL